ncbi:MAG: hypothetical protein ACOYLH_10830 [Flavobacteriales bacterium]
MDDSLIIFPENAPEIDYQELYRETFLQLKKDFNPFLDCGDLPSILNGQILYNLTLDWIKVIITEQPSHLGAILYRIDIQERKAKTELHQAIQGDSAETLARMILKREAQKVWLRKTFS